MRGYGPSSLELDRSTLTGRVGTVACELQGVPDMNVLGTIWFGELIVKLRLALLPLIAAFGCPVAFGQALMPNFSWPEMRTTLEALNVAITEQGADGDIRYFDARRGYVVFSIFGFGCDTKEPTQRCSSALLSTSITPKDADSLAKAIDAIDNMAVDDGVSPEGNIRLRRYIMFDEGISPGNLKSNLTVFLNVSQGVATMLLDKGWAK